MALSPEEEGFVVRYGMTPDEARLQVAKNREARRQSWLKTAIDPYAKKHGITRMQAISVLFCDNTSDSNSRSVYWAEANDFAGEGFSFAHRPKQRPHHA